MSSKTLAIHAVEVARNSLVTDEIQVAIIEQRRSLHKFVEYYAEHGDRFANVVAALPGLIDNYTFTPAKESFDIRIATDKETLGKIVSVLRTHGFKPNSRPSSGDTDWSTYWVHDSDAKIWLSFSSTQCKRVQVGTETREVPVYETQCDDNLLEDFVA